MDEAYKEALKAFAEGEIPIGAVIVCDGKIVARGHNARERKQIATKHAEIVAIERACKKLGSWRLENCEMYVTVEPCVMCYGAALNARIDRVYYGAVDKNGGARREATEGGEVYLNWTTEFIMVDGEDRCGELLTRFFFERRNGKNLPPRGV